MPTQLEQAVAHIKAGDIEKGRQLLIEVLKQSPRDENAWLWMTKCVTDAEQKRYCFDRVLKINPQNQHAIEGLNRLNNPAPISTPTKAVQAQPAKKNGLGTAGAIAFVGLLSFVLLCAIVFFVSRIPTNSNQQNTPVPTQRVRPDYEQMLEASGFTYDRRDNEGNPSYSSSCDAIAYVHPDSVGFAANHSSDNDCAIEEIGRAIGIMYPSEVLDSVVTTIHLLDEFDQLVTRTAVGHEVSVIITEDDRTLIILIKDPH